MMTACVVGESGDDPKTSDVEQATNHACGGTGNIQRCDGWSNPGDANAYCTLVCTLNREEGGWCFYPNPNDAFHGYCVTGFLPVAPDPEVAQ